MFGVIIIVGGRMCVCVCLCVCACRNYLISRLMSKNVLLKC